MKSRVHVGERRADRVPREAMSDDARLRRYGRTIWETSRNDESTISATGANIVARAVIAVADQEQAELRAELEKYKRGAQTLGHTIEWQCRAVLDATGMHHVIGEDGDGDWALVWERLAEMGEAALGPKDRASS